MLNIILTRQDILCVNIYVDTYVNKPCVDHSTSWNVIQYTGKFTHEYKSSGIQFMYVTYFEKGVSST